MVLAACVTGCDVGDSDGSAVDPLITSEFEAGGGATFPGDGSGDEQAGADVGASLAPARPESQAAPPRTSVPSVLVGEWDGDKFDYTITADGYVKITRLGEGTVEVNGANITFHVAGGPWTAAWRVTECADPAGYGFPFRTLFLDEISYVQDC